MIVFDIETDGLLDQMTKLHVFSWSEVGSGVVQSTNDPAKIKEVLSNAGTIIGHNIIRFDLPALKKLLGIDYYDKIVDTLPLSWYLEPSRMRHGLDDWGRTLGIEKPKVDDWDSLAYEDYKYRCEEDVKINVKLWEKLAKKLSRLYRDEAEEKRLISYMTFKMQCAADQEEYGWKLDVAKAETLAEELTRLKEEKEQQLIAAMPKNPVFKKKSPPKGSFYKKDGELTVHAENWYQFLREQKLPATTNQEVTYLDGYIDGNPNSVDQVKDWLFSIGWVPQTFKFVKDKDGERQIPQVRDGSDLCDSVKDLASVDPAVGLLDGLTVLTHRLGIVKGFLECHVDGWLKAEIAGLTNTFRFKHMKPLVNLPAVDKPYGKEIRGLLIAPEGSVLCGSDMVSLEDTTKRHYMQPYDPEYVEEMSKPGFDSHLDLAKFAGAVTQEDIDKHNAGIVSLTALRKKYKAANYACVYGVRETTLSRSTGLSKRECKKLIDAYWERNWAVKKAAEAQKVRTIGDEMWILNPVSGFWHNLRYEKDRWSTINQSTGVACFDNWVAVIKKNGIRVIAQFHDEIVAQVVEGKQEETKDILKAAIAVVNNKLKLNVDLDVDVQFGKSYEEIH